MAEKEEYPLGTPQENALICEKHNPIPIDFICEDCEEFVCTKCVKEDHKDHNWDTITTAATLKSRGLLKTLTKIEEEDIQQIDEKIEKTSQKLEENKKQYEKEVSRIQKQYDAMVEKLDKIRKQQEEALRDSLASQNADMSQFRSSLKKRKKKILRSVKLLKENSSTMTDIILLKTHRDLTKLLSTKKIDTPMSNFLSKYECGNINEETLKSMMGQKIDYVDQITVTETNSLQLENKPIELLKAIDERTCLLCVDFEDVIRVNKHSGKEKRFKLNATLNDMCVLGTGNNEVYFTDPEIQSISCLSPSGSISILFSTYPLVPRGICETTDDGLLVTLIEPETDFYQPNQHSQRLVRHMTLTGDVIREYEYQDDRQTRLFISPYLIKQNGNTDICVMNWTSETTNDLLILSYAGSLKSVYSGYKEEEKFELTDVVCDSHCNIIISDKINSRIHLLSPEGQFVGCLLSKSQIESPTALSLKNSLLWIGNEKGCIKVFQYKL